jgi:hypothetical protein
MMKRRNFLAMSGAASLAPLGALSATAAGAPASARDYLLLQQYQVADEAQRTRLDAYLRQAISVWNGLGIKPVGVFYPREGLGPTYVVLRHASPEVLLGNADALFANADLKSKGQGVLDATADNPGFKRLESSLLWAFRGAPQLQTPVHGPNRVFQLRIYESPSVAMGFKKIEMFNDAGELDVFRQVGLTGVFFGQSVVGAKMPNLTYMLGFESKEEQEAAWTRFRTSPGWLKLKAMPEYADKRILCGITNLLLKPADYSQI